jgi:hypothetical protein
MHILNEKQKFIVIHAKGLSISNIARMHPKYLPINMYKDVKILVKEEYVNKETIGRETLITRTLKGEYSI